MPRVVVILGPIVTPAARAAVSLAVRCFGGDWAASCAGEATGCYAAAAGARMIDAVDKIDVALIAFDDEQAAVHAEIHNAALVLDVIEIITSSPLRIARDLGRGEKEVMDITGPAVLAISDEAPNELYISHHRRASVPPVPPVPPLPLGEGRGEGGSKAESPWQPIRPRTRTTKIAERTAGSATYRAHTLLGVSETREDDTAHIVTTDCGQHLLRYLRHNGFIDRQVTADPIASPPTTQALTTGDAARTHILSSQIARGPRPTHAPARGLDRRPMPYSPSQRRPGRLSRSPRPIGMRRPGAVRGPFPLGEKEG